MKSFRPFVLQIPLAILSFFFFASSTSLNGQSVASEAPTAQPIVPDWQAKAGGKMQFDVASVRQDTAAQNPQTVHSNLPLGPQEMYSPTGGLFFATNYPLVAYVNFAYKLTPEQLQSVQSQLPKWANTDRYDIQARAPGNPTKDQFRLMMQALLADRFKLAIHTETRQLPILVLLLDRPGKLGPQLQPHSEDTPCPTALPPPGFPRTIAGGFPEICGAVIGMLTSVRGHVRQGARDVPITFLSTIRFTGLDRPIRDKTGLTGNFDFVIEFSRQLDGAQQPSADLRPDPTGPTFIEALKEQLGIKLESQTGPVDLLVIDHIEEPSPN